jgi:hypothetical protein
MLYFEHSEATQCQRFEALLLPVILRDDFCHNDQSPSISEMPPSQLDKRVASTPRWLGVALPLWTTSRAARDGRPLHGCFLSLLFAPARTSCADVIAYCSRGLGPRELVLFQALDNNLGGDPGSYPRQEAALFKALRLRKGLHILWTGSGIHVAPEHHIFVYRRAY